MRTDHYLKSAGLLSAALFIVAGAPAWAHGSNHDRGRDAGRHLTGSLDVCDFGGFPVGGVPKLTQYANSPTPTAGFNEVIIGQMYVQFMIPEKRRGWPIIMVHGGGYSGSGLGSTPTGHEGWFAYSVRNNNATYVVDQAGRARSGFDRSDIHERVGTGNLVGFPTFGTSDSGIWTAWFGHLLPAGSDITTGTLIKHGDPGDPTCATDPTHCTFSPAHDFDKVDPDIEARVGAIGPAPNPANNRQLALEHYKWRVPDFNNTLPTSQCSTCTPTTVNGANTWSGQDLAKLVTRLGGAIIVTHSQSGPVGHHAVRYLKAAGNLDKLKGLITIDGVGVTLTAAGTAATDYLKVPYNGLRPYYPGLSDATYQANVDAINAAGGRAEFVSLANPAYKNRFLGVTHMMMMGNGHLDVFDVIQKWVGKNIAGSDRKYDCGRANDRGDIELPRKPRH